MNKYEPIQSLLNVYFEVQFKYKLCGPKPEHQSQILNFKEIYLKKLMSFCYLLLIVFYRNY